MYKKFRLRVHFSLCVGCSSPNVLHHLNPSRTPSMFTPRIPNQSERRSNASPGLFNRPGHAAPSDYHSASRFFHSSELFHFHLIRHKSLFRKCSLVPPPPPLLHSLITLRGWGAPQLCEGELDYGETCQQV